MDEGLIRGIKDYWLSQALQLSSGLPGRRVATLFRWPLLGAALLLAPTVVVTGLGLQLGGATAQASEGYCLSGGVRNAFRCADEAPSTTMAATSLFAIQLLELAGETQLSERDDVVHVTPLADDQRLVYLGPYDSREAGLLALQQAEERWGAPRRPLLVALRLRLPMPVIRLVAEPQQAFLSHSERQSVDVENASVQSVPITTASATAGFDQVYGIQVAAYEQAAQGQQFARQHSEIPLLCRVRDNGLFTIYYGVYESADNALVHLQDYPLLSELGAYVVRLRDVSFESCSGLAERIDDSRERARQERQQHMQSSQWWFQHYLSTVTESLLQLPLTRKDI